MTEFIAATSANGVEIGRVGPIAFIGGKCQFWAWSPYDKCSYRCIYCSIEAQGKSRPAIAADEIGPLLDSYLMHKHTLTNPLVLGTTADAYPPEELEYGLTRKLLEELATRDIPFSIVTHGDIIVRDIGLLRQSPGLRNVVLSIPHACDGNIRKYEPGAPSFEARIRAVELLLAAGLPVSVNIAPWVPELTDVERIVDALPAGIEINVGPLYYNADNLDLVNNLCGREMSSSQRVFGKKYPLQRDINTLYLAEYSRIGVGKHGNLKWLPVPDGDGSFTAKLPDIFPSI